MKIKAAEHFKPFNRINENVRYDFLYVESTYAGVLASSRERLHTEEERFIQNHKEQIEKLNHREPYVIIKSYDKDFLELLNKRVCMTQLLTEDCHTLGVIWYDDGSKDIKESLLEVYSQIDWAQSKEFDF